MVAESDGTLEVCVVMTTSQPSVALAKQVDLTLSTMSGSGKVSSKRIMSLDLNSMSLFQPLTQTSQLSP